MGQAHAGTGAATATRVLVISQHEAVRRQLVIYLGRLPSLDVDGHAFSSEAIAHADPDVLVLDLSQLDPGALGQTLDAVRLTGARLVALASMREPADERAVTGVGGLYRLKSAGADGLGETVLDLARQATGSRA